MDGATIEEEIGDDIQKGARARKFEATRHGRACFQVILGIKESIKCFMQRGEVHVIGSIVMYASCGV